MEVEHQDPTTPEPKSTPWVKGTVDFADNQVRRAPGSRTRASCEAESVMSSILWRLLFVVALTGAFIVALATGALASVTERLSKPATDSMKD